MQQRPGLGEGRDGDVAASLLEVEDLARAVALARRIRGQVALSRSYGWPSAAGAMLRPMSPASTMMVIR